MPNKQSQKTGDSGVNQQAQSGGVNQNAGRDAYNNCTVQTNKKEQDFGIIAEIFDYIFQNKIDVKNKISNREDGKITQLKEKLSLNFEEDERKEIEVLLTKNWGRIEIVEKYIQEQNEISPERIDALVLKIKSFYREKKKCSSSEEKIENADALDKITKEFIPAENLTNPDYYANSLAIILYFFEMCEIGKKTSIESQTLFNPFD